LIIEDQNNKYLKKFNFCILILFLLGLNSCGSIKFTNDYISASSLIKSTEPSTIEKQNWYNLDIADDSIPGMSVDKAYNELLRGLKADTVIVAVIDTGIDIYHEDLQGLIWVNENEIPNNNIDDDDNGYVDDIHGWNYLEDAYDETLEMTRIFRDNKINNRKYNLVESEIEKGKKEYQETLNLLDRYIAGLTESNRIISEYLGDENFKIDDVNNISTDSVEIKRSKDLIVSFNSVGYDLEYLNEGKKIYEEYIMYHYNTNHNGRKSNDNIYDINDTDYGNNNVLNINSEESHSTHVAGIIAGLRENKLGNKGVNNHVKIMAIRAVPNGDEYDKDIARSIRYAVDNGARIINCSFGKYFSSNPEWVIDAIRYASENNVLIVHGAGNDSKNLDLNKNDNYPNDQYFGKPEFSNTFINVGASSINYDKNIYAVFSDYGKETVDVFAPGVEIYSLLPNNKYDFLSGTSMAAPAVAGVASLILSYFPKLSAKKVKEIIMESGISIDFEIDGINDNKRVSFKDISKSGKIVNAYNALILASRSKKR